MSNETLETLLKELKYLSGMNERMIARSLGYSASYITEIRSRGEISPKFIAKLRDEIEKYSKNNHKVDAYDPGMAYTTRVDKLLEIIESQQTMLTAQQNTIHLLVESSLAPKKNRSA